ncbi:methyltransferase domain-containing protein [Ilumatobacter sp.]|uniref:methyltransferase domain-containing protein n=1 Tax=Ilumatobacter sp. TaxID=1967498 RepID=UPI003AF79203
MDLTERGASTDRHPWEVQRFRAYRRVLADHGALAARRVLDVGAGDGWFSDMLADSLSPGAVTVCWDVNYDDNDLEPSRPGQARTRDRPDGGHDLVLLLDVLEHIDDPDAFIAGSLRPITESGTPALVAVPAYQALFGAHDVSLGHHRRYARRELLDQLAPWVDVVEHGSLFTSLLLPRAVTVVAERFRPAADAVHGVGNWSGGSAVTAAANGCLAADARIGRALARTGIRVPGLSHWAFGRVR